ncbi:retinol dehydrogenase 7-like isoform X1 [Salvelinus alpinus]|uniref:retinol dehydrogenase 7-like isoform X1 n=1 Tax=Salvelinus alpinus TaxID=8036 RepID=UPI0039FBF417
MFLYILGLVAFWFVFRWYRELARVPNKGQKYVYITGCDSGFGNLLARHLDKLGFRVIAACYTEKGEDELKKVSSERLNTVHLDVVSTDSVSNATAFIKTLVGEKGLWAVVNNAGVSVPSGPCDWMTVDDYKSMLDVNLIGVIGVTLSVLPLIKKARGRVVNVASVFGRISAFGGPYCVSKYGVEAFNDSLRMNMSAFGVKVLCLEPGFFKTSVTDLHLLRKNVKTLWDKLPEEIKDQYGHDYPERGFWGLINNAGRTTPIGPTEWMQLEDFRKVLDVNLIGLIEVTLKFLPLLKKAQGSVVNVASIPGEAFPQWRRLLSIQVWCGGLL